MRVRFDDCEIDLATVELRRAGELVDVQPQVFSLIEYLLDHRDRVVSKEELLDNIWGDRFVGESALTTRIKSARKALGDDGKRQAVIKTVHGRGYRFVADVVADDTQSDGLEPAGEQGDEAQAASAGSNGDAKDDSVAGSNGDVLHWPTELPAIDGAWPFVGRFPELAGVELMYREGRRAGVVIKGPDGVGKSRFGAECLRRFAGSGVPTVAVRALGSTRSIPLSALGGLLPEDIVRSEHQAEDLARADVFRRSYDVLKAMLADGPARPVVLIDDVDLLDEMSAAVLTSAIADGHAFGLVVQRPGRSEPGDPLADLLSGDRLHPIQLGPLTEVDLDVLLYRALGGPIDQVTLDQLDAASGRKPGVLRDIVNSSLAAGTLDQRDGVWQLTGPVTSSMASAWPPDDLSALAVDGAERLALLGPVRLDLATSAVPEQGLAALDAGGLLRTVDHPDGGQPTVSLADPVLAAAVTEAVTPLRARRLKTDLAPVLAGFDDPGAVARLVDWGDDYTDELDNDRVVGSAFTALLADDLAVAEQLASSVDAALNPAAAVVLGEVALKRGQWERAEAVLSAVDTDQLDPFLASLAVRRQVTLRFTHHGEYRSAVEQLADEEARWEGEVARAVGARRISLLTLSGRYQEVLDLAPSLDGTHGVTHLEILVSLAGAELGVGNISSALQRCRLARLMVDEVVPAPWRDESIDAIASTECSAHLQMGDLERATEVLREHLRYGVRASYGILPTKGAEIELEAGRPRAARAVLESSLDGSSRNEFPQFVGLADTLSSRIDLALGRRQRAIDGIDRATAALDSAPPVMRWRIAIWLAELLVAADGETDAVDMLCALADEAAAAGAPEAEVDLLCAASAVDPGPETARRVLDRVEPADRFDGALWPNRVDHVRARANDDASALTKAADRYRTMGYVRYADLADLGR